MKARIRIARNLRRLRVARGYSIEYLAGEAGADTSHVGRIERAVVNCSVECLERLAAVLGHDIQEFLAVPSGNKPPEPLRAGRRRGARR